MADKEGGWVKFYRSIWDWRGSPIKENRPFTKSEAWLWLISAASYKDNVYRGIPVKRGQVLTSQVKLANLWRRDRKTVRAWIRDFQKNGEIWSARGQSWSLITICEYDKYQGDSPPDSPSDSPPNSPPNSPPDSPLSRKKKKVKKEKKKSDTESAKPKLTNIQEFDEWWQSHKPDIRDIVLNITGQEVLTEWLATWVKKHYPNMRGWFIADPTRRKKRFGQFVTNWLKNEWGKHLGDGPGMTAAEEERHYASKQRTDNGSGMTSISEIINKAQGE